MTSTARRMDQVGLDFGRSVPILQAVFDVPPSVLGPLWPPVPGRSLRAVPPSTDAPTRRIPVFGGARGTVTMRDDFDDPLPEFDDYAP